MNKVSVRARVPVTLKGGIVADFVSFNGLADGKEHIAILFAGRAKTPLVRIHSECLTGDVFGSARCDCGAQLDEAIRKISEEGGIILYMRQEGRGIGLYNKLDAYALQIEQGLDTYEANRRLGFPEDGRDYRIAADMLRAMGVQEISLLSSNPEKARGLAAEGIAIEQMVPTSTFMTTENKKYLCTKVTKTGHTLRPE